MQHHIDIMLRSGVALTVDYEDAFVEKVRQAYSIPEDIAVSDNHIRKFIQDTISSAITQKD